LFIVTTDEQDHVAETLTPTPTGCDGINTPCVYDHTPTSAGARNVATVGEVNVNLSRLLNTEKGNTTAFSVHSDLAPTFYINGNPAQTAASTRQLERDVASLSTYNPYSGLTENPVDFIADQAGMSMIHMVTADSARTPNFVAFQKGDYYSFASGTGVCTETNYTDCVNIKSGFAYNHGGYQPEITTAWLGMVGPGVKVGNGVRDTTTWTDHTDIRPTLLTLAGLTDSYQHDGRVMVEVLNDSALPSSLAAGNRTAFVQLAQAYKQINASVGALGLKTLAASTVALTGNDAGDLTYTSCTAKINSWVATRNTLAQEMIGLLEGAALHGTPVDPTVANSLISQANSLIANATCP